VHGPAQEVLEKKELDKIAGASVYKGPKKAVSEIACVVLKCGASSGERETDMRASALVIAPSTAVSAVWRSRLALRANYRGPGYDPVRMAGPSLACASNEE